MRQRYEADMFGLRVTYPTRLKSGHSHRSLAFIPSCASSHLYVYIRGVFCLPALSNQFQSMRGSSGEYCYDEFLILSSVQDYWYC